MMGDGDGSFRQAGIRLLPPGPAGGSGGTGTDTAPPASSTENQPGTGSPSSATGIAVPPVESSMPPIALSLPRPQQASGIIGAGASMGLTTLPLDNLVRPSNPGGGGVGGIGGIGLGSGGTGGGTGGGDGAGGGGGTSFLGVKGVGKKFVYVIDRSFSMANDHALQAAKIELLSSLQRLDETQQFQIIFYNNEYVVLNARGGRFQFFRGTDAQRLLVTEQMREITPAAGTRHLPALLEALNFKPDVIFLLTDGAAESALAKKDLEQIRLLNRQGTSIHCIEFGRGEKSNLEGNGNFLRVLAKENRGEYVYRNLKTGF